MKLSNWLIIAVLTGSTWLVPGKHAWAEEPDPFDSRLIPLELVMSFRSDINLSRAQNDAIGEMVVELQQSVAAKQWQMQSAYFDLIEALDQPKIDEKTALDLVATAVTTENEIKLAQVRFLIRLRNLLEPEQIAYLRQKRDEGWVKP